MPKPKTSASRTKLSRTKVTSTRQTAQTVELEISLSYIKPRIWRRFAVPATIKLSRLHDVIQIVMGWEDDHLHEFDSDAGQFAPPRPDDWGWQDETEVRDERKHTLLDLIAAKGDRFTYTYDFGDDWHHEAKVTAIEPADQPLKFAVCRGGERACPPEDCGSVPGYGQLVKALANPEHPAHDELKEWAGDYDPAHFDLDAVNRALRRIKL